MHPVPPASVAHSSYPLEKAWLQMERIGVVGPLTGGERERGFQLIGDGPVMLWVAGR